MGRINKHTCVKFVPRAGEEDYVEVVSEKGKGYVHFMDVDE
jgi:hypothetical protein